MPSETAFRRHFVLPCAARIIGAFSISYTPLRAHETSLPPVCRLPLDKKKPPPLVPPIQRSAVSNPHLPAP
ncbi:hypothetical protein C5B32_13290 [Neisseria gonorrhoeae]|nr:hypothetical protein C5B32_13290 [Neisseria gonorrhoeae]